MARIRIVCPGCTAKSSAVLAKYMDFKHRLMSDIYTQAINAHLVGHPIQRAMLVDFIDDRTTHSLDQQYMLGPNLLFAPVFGDEKFETEYYIPAGTWSAVTPLIGTKEPRVIVVKEAVRIGEIPPFVRPGSVIVLAPPGIKKPEFNLSNGVEVRVYELSPGITTTCDIPSGHGSELVATLQVTREGDKSIIKIVKDSLEEWSIRLFKDGLTNVSDIQGAALYGQGECTEHGGFLVKVDSRRQRLQSRLELNACMYNMLNTALTRLWFDYYKTRLVSTWS